MQISQTDPGVEEVRPLVAFDLAHLGPRTAEVAGLAALGRSRREIAAELHMAVSTVERHITRLHAEFGTNNSAALACAILGSLAGRAS